MIAIRKLLALTTAHRYRKAAQTLALVERSFRRGDLTALPWVRELAAALASDGSLPIGIRDLAARGAGVDCESAAIAFANRLRRALDAHSGAAPADWDFMEPLGLSLDCRARAVYPGVKAWLEDIRSPFNVGSMFRTADAFGASELLLSEFTADPAHPRAARSAMGAAAIVPWRRAGLDDLGSFGTLFALELRGEDVDTFRFPERGVVIIGSEELGVSPEALARCSARVTIPMLGAKGSLNAGVAFGILMAAWRRSLEARGLSPEAIAEDACRDD